MPMLGPAALSPLSRLLALIVAGPNPRTARAHQSDLEDFRAFVSAADVTTAVQRLLDIDQTDANLLVHEYRASMAKRSLSSATINRRLSSLRGLVRQARTLGLVNWTLDVENLPAQAYRDTRGPGRSGVERILQSIAEHAGPKARRDFAAVRLLFDLALRREEVVALDLADLDMESSQLAVLGKGRTQKVRLTLPDPTRAALAAWTAERGTEPGPLFPNFDRAGKGGRLTGRSLHRIVLRFARQAGLRHVSPHALRHAAITEALNLTNGDVRAVQRFSRHRDLRVLNIYDDCREDLAGQVARVVAAGAPAARRLSTRRRWKQAARPCSSPTGGSGRLAS